MSMLYLRAYRMIASPAPLSPDFVKALLRCIGVTEMYALHERPDYYQSEFNSIDWTEVHMSYKGKARAIAALKSLEEVLNAITDIP